MIQSHLLQVLAVLAMEPPSTLGRAGPARREGRGAARDPRLGQDSPTESSRRARYTGGTVEGEKVPGLRQGARRRSGSRDRDARRGHRSQIDTWRWAGVPFTLRSGKALGERRREVVVTFKPAQHVPTGLTGTQGADQAAHACSRPTRCSSNSTSTARATRSQIERASMTVEFGPGQLLAYGEVLEGILDGDPSLSVRGDTAVECWRIVAPVISGVDEGRGSARHLPRGLAGSVGVATARLSTRPTDDGAHRVG